MTAPTISRPAELAPSLGDVLHAAGRLIRDRGFWPGGFGNHNIGYSVEGAIYRVLRLHVDDLTLADAPDDDPRWQTAYHTFQLVATQLGEHRPSLAYGRVCDWSEQGDRDRAIALLGKAADRWRATHLQDAA